MLAKAQMNILVSWTLENKLPEWNVKYSKTKRGKRR